MLGLVYLIKAEPTLLPEVKVPEALWALENRRRTTSGGYRCLRCYEPARHAYVAETDQGPRWLDMCAPCGSALRKALEDYTRENIRRACM